MVTLIQDSSVCQSSSLLDQFPQERRSVIANQFFTAVREGSITVDEVLRSVKGDAIRRMMFPENRERWNTQRQLVALLGTEAAREYVRQVLEREALPPEEKLRLKAERQERFRRDYLRAQTPTEKQLSYLKSLGCKTVPTDRQHASELIEAHK
jgi:hypothetical protein